MRPSTQQEAGAVVQALAAAAAMDRIMNNLEMQKILSSRGIPR